MGLRATGARSILQALAAGLLLDCLGPTVGQVDLGGLDTPVEKGLSLAGGKKLTFPVHADDYRYTGGNHVAIEVTLLRASVPVATMSCLGFEFEGGAGCGSSATELNSACSMQVPPGGSDAIRVVASLSDKRGSATVKGLSLYIRD